MDHNFLDDRTQQGIVLLPGIIKGSGELAEKYKI